MLIGDMNTRVGNNKVNNIVGTNGEATLNNISNKLTDFCTCNNVKIMNTFLKHKEIHKFTLEAIGHKSIIDYFITNMRTSKAVQDIRAYRGNELDTDHYLLFAKVNFPNKQLNKNKNKKVSVKLEEFFKYKTVK